MRGMTKDNKYYYSGRNSKGEPKFRRDTNESYEEVEGYLKSKGYEFEWRTPYMMRIFHKHMSYTYYYTTGKWSAFRTNFKSYKAIKSYSSNGIEDFITRFIERGEKNEPQQQ